VEPHLLLPAAPFETLDDYVAAGGGEAFRLARAKGGAWVLDEIGRAGLRGRGGAGFPSATKWRSIADAPPSVGDRYVVANGAEGEPGTFKDRPLLRSNPYQVIEGLAIAADLVHAREAFIGVKRSFTREIAAIERALEEMAAAGLLCDAPVTLVGGPEEYLFGEETGLLEVIEGNDPMPRWLQPYLHGLFATTPQEGWSAGAGADVHENRTGSNPTLVTNVESLANVPLILARGAAWYRTIGTDATPGPLIATVVGDTVRAGYGEIEPGTSLRAVVDELGGGPRPGRTVKAVLSGVSNAVITADALDAPVSYEGLSAVGSGLGSAGFVVYDDTRDMLELARTVSRFLYVESCGQCRSCKLGCGEITRRLDDLAEGPDGVADLEIVGRWLRNVTDQTRCFLAAEEQRLVSSLLRAFPDEFATPRRAPVTMQVPKIVDIADGVARFDEAQARKRPDWTYAPA
jgi:NADH-quinone oxidoreductase subunit F